MSRLYEAMERARLAGTLVLQDDAARPASTAGLELFDPSIGENVPREQGLEADRTAKSGARVSPLPRFDSDAQSMQQHVAGFVQRLFVSPDRADRTLRSVMFAGVGTLDRSALVSAAAAEVLASRVVGRVCLVDANISSPSLHACYRQPNDEGLVQAIGGMAPSRTYARRLAHGDGNSLWLVAAGAAEGTADSVLTAEAGALWIRDLLGAFDYVIIAAPPVSHAAASAAVLGGLVDGVVLVVEANLTRRSVARAAVNQLRASGVRVLGTVLNNRTFPVPDSIYRHL